LSELLERRGIVWQAAVNVISCFAHVIQLAVKNLLDLLKASAANESITLSFDEDNLTQIIKDVKSEEMRGL